MNARCEKEVYSVCLPSLPSAPLKEAAAAQHTSQLPHHPVFRQFHLP